MYLHLHQRRTFYNVFLCVLLSALGLLCQRVVAKLISYSCFFKHQLPELRRMMRQVRGQRGLAEPYAPSAVSCLYRGA